MQSSIVGKVLSHTYHGTKSRVGNWAFLVANATKNFALATRISQLVTSGRLTISGHDNYTNNNFDSTQLPPFSLIRDFGKQNTKETLPKFPSVFLFIDRLDRNPPITATSVTFRPS